MSLLYTVKKGHINTLGLREYYISQHYCYLVEFDHLCKRICKESSLTDSDVSAVVTAAMDLICELTLDSSIVDLGEMGRFRATFASRLVASEAECGPRCLKNMRLLWVPTPDMMRLFRNVEFIKWQNEV